MVAESNPLRVNFEELDINDDYQNLVDGEPFTGIAFEKYDNGILSVEVSFVDGIENGVRRTYYSSGHLKSEENLESGGLNGICRYWYESDQLKAEKIYERGKFVGERLWDEKGKLIGESNFKLWYLQRIMNIDDQHVHTYSRSLTNKLISNIQSNASRVVTEDDLLMLEAAKEWLRLLNTDEPNKHDVDMLLNSIEMRKESSSVWYEMYLYCKKWRDLLLVGK